MSIHPTIRGLALVAAWLGIALLLLPSALPESITWVLGGIVVALAGIDAARLAREPGLRVARSLPERATVGVPLEATLQVENGAARPIVVSLHEARPRGTTGEDTLTLHVPAGDAAEGRIPILPGQRGDLDFGRAVALHASPFGLWRRRSEVEGDTRLRVYPNARALVRSQALDPRRALEQLGARTAPRRGEGLDFESLRDYVSGDDPRRIDWAATARRGRPVVRQYQHERNHHIVVALDTSRLLAARIGERSKLDHAIDAALTIAAAGLACGDRIAMAGFDRELHGFLAPRGGRRDLGAFLEFVQPLAPRPVEADFEAFVRGLTARQRHRSLVVVLTDFVEVESAPLARALGVLAKRHRVLLVALRDPILHEVHPQAPPRGDAEEDLLRRLVLTDLVQSRETALLGLRRAAVQTLDLAPAQVTGETLNRLLELRRDL